MQDFKWEVTGCYDIIDYQTNHNYAFMCQFGAKTSANVMMTLD